MLCYFIAKKDFKILNCVEVAGYSVAHDLDCGGKTNITIAGDPGASDEDFVILKDGNKVKFRGIVEKIDNADGGIKYDVSCFEIERCFDRKIVLSDVNLISNSGIEDFVANTIEKHFANTGDPFSDMPYIKCEVLTHTKVSSKPAAEDGIYNLKTYIGNIKQQYGIYLDFDFTKDGLHISIYKKEQSAMQIDTTITDIYTCKETYKIKVLSKLIVKWLNTTTISTFQSAQARPTTSPTKTQCSHLRLCAVIWAKALTSGPGLPLSVTRQTAQNTPLASTPKERGQAQAFFTSMTVISTSASTTTKNLRLKTYFSRQNSTL